MARLSIVPIVRGHWKGLTSRTHGRTLLVTADTPARLLTVGVPVCATVGAALWLPPMDAEWALGTALTWAALVSAGLLGTFALLASWRTRLSERTNQPGFELDDRPLRGLIDEAVAHVLLGVLESLAVAILAVVAYVTDGVIRRGAAWLAAGFWAHTIFLFILVASRVYSAYVQAENVPPEVDGFSTEGRR